MTEKWIKSSIFQTKVSALECPLSHSCSENNKEILKKFIALNPNHNANESDIKK